MGREIRRVPPTWEHPTQRCPHSPWAGGCDWAKTHGGECFKPIFDRDFESAMKEWMDGLEAWIATGFQEFLAEYNKDGEYKENEPYRAYCEWEGCAPDPDSHRSPWDQEPTAYQMYETVSEGTPVSPVFATKAELVDYLTNHGCYWDQRRAKRNGGDPRWSREAAEGFVESEWSASGLFNQATGEFFTPNDAGMYADRKVNDD